MNRSEISCKTVHPFVRKTFHRAPEEEPLLEQIAACASTEFVNNLRKDADAEQEPITPPMLWESVYDIARLAAELALYAHKAMTEVPDVTH